MTDLMEHVRAALGGQSPLLLPQTYPLSPDITARLAAYSAAQHRRAAEHERLVTRDRELEQEIRTAKEEFFAHLKTVMPELAGKALQLNGDGTYQLFADLKAAANETEHD